MNHARSQPYDIACVVQQHNSIYDRRMKNPRLEQLEYTLLELDKWNKIVKLHSLAMYSRTSVIVKMQVKQTDQTKEVTPKSIKLK